MPKYAILLVHRCSPTAALLVAACRANGVEPVVLSSAANARAQARFAALCAELGVAYKVGNAVLGIDDISAIANGALDRYSFCLAVWDGQRPLMAEVNARLGAPDITVDAVGAVQDKFRFRERARARSLSNIIAYPLNDPRLYEMLAAGHAYIVKPRRAAGALCTGRVTSLAEMRALETVFARGPAHDDLFAEFFGDNELFAEDYFEGREFSFEIVRYAGETMLFCEHEKLALRVAAATILETAFAAPAITISQPQLEGAKALIERALETFNLTHGCYHVEARLGDCGRWELLEVNPRIGGGFVAESVQRQFGRSMLNEWIAMLIGTAPSKGGQRSCGAVFQVHYADEPRRIAALRKDPNLPEPDLFKEVATSAAVGSATREEIVALSFWRTDLRTHAAAAAVLAAHEYVTVEYESAAHNELLEARLV